MKTIEKVNVRRDNLKCPRWSSCGDYL